MTEKEAETILLEAYFQTPNSRADYFRIKATEGNYNPVTFYLDLSEAYNRIEQYVNSPEPGVCGMNELGEREIIKKSIPLRKDGYQVGLVTCDNLIELLEPLHEFGKSLGNILKTIAALESKEKDKEIKVKSFSWTGSDEQKKELYEALKGAGYIDQRTTKEAFTAIFSGSEIDSNLHRITWIKENRKHTVNKTALREFLTLLLDKFQEKIVPLFFIDKDKKPISLSKPKKREPSNYILELEIIINKVKNNQLPDH